MIFRTIFAGESMRTFYTRIIQGSAIDAIAVATEVLNALPNQFTTFYCLHSFQGIRSVRGFIYDSKLHGEFFIEALSGESHRVFLSNGTMKEIK